MTGAGLFRRKDIEDARLGMIFREFQNERFLKVSMDKRAEWMKGNPILSSVIFFPLAAFGSHADAR